MMVRWNNGRAHKIPRSISWSCEEASIVVNSIDYDVAHGAILSTTPYVLANQTLKNNSDDEQEMLFDFSETVTRTR
ncbi:hypothetical protein EDD18DRAFT_1185306 [Armillaria luteobubalina]|uniref:Uncharacterized protein n=1 Tax=Armillaria luteobubalina TaxID=153913 RepID=A0AA39UPL4_9AGAR|nr:hypothetical protein EDD18DRAFT_1185306 [Armillaria luteobubalina]